MRRKPTPAPAPTTLPTLATMLAVGALVEGCAHVECGDERVDEVRAHGPRAVESLRAGQVRDGLRQVAVATGLVGHVATRVEPVRTAGAVAPVTLEPTHPTDTIPAPGQMAVVTDERRHICKATGNAGQHALYICNGNHLEDRP